MLASSPQLEPVLASQLHRRLDCLGSTRERIHQIQVTRTQGRQLAGELFHCIVRESSAVHIGHAGGLTGECVGNLTDAVPDVDHVGALLNRPGNGGHRHAKR